MALRAPCDLADEQVREVIDLERSRRVFGVVTRPQLPEFVTEKGVDFGGGKRVACKLSCCEGRDHTAARTSPPPTGILYGLDDNP
eukprot:scaffold10600_cov52-Phaeocystis_antarctica.AAC.2